MTIIINLKGSLVKIKNSNFFFFILISFIRKFKVTNTKPQFIILKNKKIKLTGIFLLNLKC